MTYSRWERLHFKLFKSWPQSVVQRRLAELHERETEARLKHLAEMRRIRDSRHSS